MLPKPESSSSIGSSEAPKLKGPSGWERGGAGLKTAAHAAAMAASATARTARDDCRRAEELQSRPASTPHHHAGGDKGEA